MTKIQNLNGNLMKQAGLNQYVFNGIADPRLKDVDCKSHNSRFELLLLHIRRKNISPFSPFSPVTIYYYKLWNIDAEEQGNRECLRL